uniref:SOCS box domain-containing protein n=1 Tax=Parascaris univalens TaxID=6257 RepID=A0A915BWZ1_PARUN
MAKVCHSLVGNDEGIAHISCTEERLQLAVKNGHYEYVRFLLQNDADPISGRFSDPEMSLIYQEDANLTAFLLSFGGNPNVYDHEGLTPLMRACRKGDAGTTTAIVLLTYGADVNAFAMPEQDLRTPLHYAVLYGSIKLVSLLIEHGAHVNQPCGYDRPSVLNLAVLKDDPELLRLLLDAGAKPNAVHTSIGSSLHIAACSPLKNQFEIMRLLLEFGADVNLRHTLPEGDVLPTPFVEYFKSQEKVDKKVVHLLLAYGAEVIVRSPLTDARGQLFNLREIYILQPDVFNVMLDVGEEYECTAIDRLSTVDSLKKLLISKASCPASLQQQCRLRIRRLLIPMCPAKVATLSIPEHLRPYLLGYAL